MTGIDDYPGNLISSFGGMECDWNMKEGQDMLYYIKSIISNIGFCLSGGLTWSRVNTQTNVCRTI